jgi:2-haloacid dehalogenase
MDTTAAVVFDAYGTLFDVHSVVRRGEELFPAQGADLSRLWRAKQLEYTWLRSLMGRYEDFESVTRGALRFACRALDLAWSDEVERALVQEYLQLSLYPDVSEALRALQGRKLAILSNGSPAMLQAVVEHAGLAPLLHHVLSVDELRIYKPHRSVYRLAVEKLGTVKEQIAFVSSNFWDVSGATAFGFRTYWINRTGTPADELGLQPAGTLSRLDELVDILN